MSICLLMAALIAACGGGSNGFAEVGAEAAQLVASASAGPTEQAGTQQITNADSSEALRVSGLESVSLVAISSVVSETGDAGLPEMETKTASTIAAESVFAANTAGGTPGGGARQPAPAPAPAPAPPPAPAPVSPGVVDVGCGPDVGGWTTPVPSRADRSFAFRDIRQPGSRLHYINSRQGSDQTGEIYFWDGGRIVDSAGKPADAYGRAYGNDPTNPSTAVRPFKRWAYVAPRNSANADIGTAGVVGGATPAFRGGFPDWWLFARGETYDLSSDLLSFERETKPSATSVNSSLAVPGGRSITERQIVGAYGDVCLPRPRFVHPQLGFVTRLYRTTDPTIFRNVAYLSLHFDGHDRTSGLSFAGVYLTGQTAASSDVLFEDVWSDGTTGNYVQSAAAVTFRRSLITDSFGVTHSPHIQGVYYYGKDKTGILRFEESVLLRNGFTGGDPSLSWPPRGGQYWDMYSRNMYFTGTLDTSKSWFRDSISMIGASGDQFRGGMRVERSFFFQGYVSHGGYNGAYSESTGSFVDNVIQKFRGTGTDDNRGHPGWGLTLGGGATDVEVARNIITTAADKGNTWRSLAFVPSSTDCTADKTNLRAPNKGNKVHGNVIDAGLGNSVVQIDEGVRDVDQPCMKWTFRSTTGNEVSSNVFVNAKLKESLDVVTPMAAGTTTDTLFARNQIFANRATAAAALGWSDPNRSLKTYMQAAGVVVNSEDGFPEYFAQATQQRRGQWRPKWTSRELVNYFRNGFGMAPLP